MNSGSMARGGTTTMAHSMSNTSSGFSANRQSELSSSRPPYATQPGARSGATANSMRSWNAQGRTTDSGRAPQGFGSSNRPATSPNGAMNGTRSYSANRPPYAGSSSNPGAYRGYSANRPPSSYNGGRSYSPPAYTGSRSYSAPRSNTPAPRSYSAPHSSAPSGGGSHSGGGGGGYHGGGGGGGHAGGGGGHH
jgi:hypothetical protein